MSFLLFLIISCFCNNVCNVSGLALPEGVALSYLIERAMEWQEKVRAIIVKHRGLATAPDKQGNLPIVKRNRVTRVVTMV